MVVLTQPMPQHQAPRPRHIPRHARQLIRITRQQSLQRRRLRAVVVDAQLVRHQKQRRKTLPRAKRPQKTVLGPQQRQAQLSCQPFGLQGAGLAPPSQHRLGRWACHQLRLQHGAQQGLSAQRSTAQQKLKTISQKVAYTEPRPTTLLSKAKTTRPPSAHQPRGQCDRPALPRCLHGASLRA